MDFKAMRAIKELFAHHRKFTPFQKVLIVSVFMGVILCLLRSWWCMGILATYTVTLYSSVSVTKYILICKTLLPSDVVLSSYETIKDYALHAIYLCNTRCDPSVEDIVTSGNEEVHDTSKKQLHKYGSEEEEIFNDGTDSTLVLSNKHMHALCIEKHISSTLTSQIKLEKEIHAVISLIKRDFFESWYSLFSKEVSTLDDAESLFNHVSEEMEGRLSHADSHKLFESILLLLKDHLHYVHQSKTMFKVQSKSRRKSQADTSTWSFAKSAVFTSIEDCYGSKVGLHPAVKSLEIEHVYQKSIIELLLVHLLWDDMRASKTLVCALKEILMCNILQNIIDLLCDATFLHEKIIKITSDEELCVSEVNIPTITISEIKPQEQDVHTILTNRFETHSNVRSGSQKETGDTNSENKVIESELNTSEDKVQIIWKEDIEVFPVSQKICFECNRLDSVDKDRISPRPHTCSLGTAPIFFIPEQESDRQSVDTISSTSSVEFKNCEDTYEETEGDIPDLKTDEQSITNDENQGTIDNASKSEDKSPKDTVLSTSSDTEEKQSSNIFPSLRFSFPNPLNFIDRKRLSPSSEGATPDCEEVEIRRSKSHGDVITLSPDVLSESEENPSVFQDVRISGTETAKEPLSHNEYTLYIVEFEALYQSEESGLVHKTGMVKRRHSEFINLQSRLDDNSRYRKRMKDVKGPKKILPSLPFGNMGKDIVDNRKQLLESFLKSLLAKPDLCNSKEVEQFLGYCGDGHIAFVRKIQENTGSRIDQRVVKTMSDVFDKIVEGFPSLPQQLPRIIPQFEQSEEKDVKPKAEVELSNDTDDIGLIYDDEVEMSSKELTSVLEKFITHKVTSGDMDNDTSLNNTTLGTSMLSWQYQQQQQQQGVSDNPTGHTTLSENKPPSIAIQNVSTLECPLSNAALDLLTELLQRQDHWMCRESVIVAVKVLLGKGINRLIEEKVEFFTSTDMILFYMKTLHETVWPDDELSTDQRPRYSDLQKEKIKLQATKCLTEFLPGILKFLIGNEESDMAVEEIMDSLKYEKLNRHFWYTALDIVLEELFPEVNTQELQRKLSGSLNSS